MRRVVLAAVGLMTLVGCGSSSPEASSESVTQTFRRFIQREMPDNLYIERSRCLKTAERRYRCVVTAGEGDQRGSAVYRAVQDQDSRRVLFELVNAGY